MWFLYIIIKIFLKTDLIKKDKEFFHKGKIVYESKYTIRLWIKHYLDEWENLRKMLNQ